MTIEQKIGNAFASELGQQCNSLFSTSDGEVFIRVEEAIMHTNEMINAVGDTEFVDTKIYEWFEEWHGGQLQPEYIQILVNN